ncbi:retropepsin-like aspartic protease family protein [Chitinimonas sp. BJB300]|uniref:retropepsin-like aspartic protease family protein n=1 Tax=Chitinimonas sp. BJB300 TaxID=1559339 RepID=UPI000C111318|nr:TIGR02281 family clan AA aspartic protease [Chitinimonas sp. BJB300]PHV12016.1 TIGR02281 family clan AA aspartic protease [Chitinimonas sp. BJB300]TSJ91459.1 TIGR02281 family clan AA aspartic protease [Chitinimonas sp. BJB300]
MHAYLPALITLFLSLPVMAAAPVLLATMGNKVSVSFGGKPITMSVGQTMEGVRLVAIGTDSAVFESRGKRRQIGLGQEFFASGGSSITGTSSSGDTVTLFDAGSGHFLAQISTGQSSVRGVIDTGATFLSLSSAHAAQLGINYGRDRPVQLSTAQGRKIAWMSKATAIKLEGIPLYEVDVVVTEGNFPEVPLIGMSVLNRLQMLRDGDNMTLRKKY